jgi:hypothetical protein
MAQTPKDDPSKNPVVKPDTTRASIPAVKPGPEDFRLLKRSIKQLYEKVEQIEKRTQG